MRAPLLLVILAIGAAACEDMNKPAYVPKSEPRKSCFSDVECPGAKCIKTNGAVQGSCATGEDGGANVSAEGGAPGDTTPPPLPPPKPAPGDIQI